MTAALRRWTMWDLLILTGEEVFLCPPPGRYIE
jgi:hypothetical protein